MDTEKAGKGEGKIIPPYLPYKTFTNFLDGLRVSMPSRIDRSIMGSMAGSAQGQLIAALKYLRLTNSQDAPTDRLTRLVNSEGPEREKALRDVLTSGYPFLFKDGVDLVRITPRLLDEQFEGIGASGDTVRKCVAFFLAAAKDAGVPLSPHLAKIKRGPRPANQRTRRGTSQPSSSSRSQDFSDLEPSSEQVSWSKLLLAKFPSFDPAWAPEVQAKWFGAFEKLMKKAEAEESGAEQ